MKILYFVRGGIPTAEQKAEADGMGALIRNASIISGDFIEGCDAVAGDVPLEYAGFLVQVPGNPVDKMNAGQGEGIQMNKDLPPAKKPASAKSDTK